MWSKQCLRAHFCDMFLGTRTQITKHKRTYIVQGKVQTRGLFRRTQASSSCVYRIVFWSPDFGPGTSSISLGPRLWRMTVIPKNNMPLIAPPRSTQHDRAAEPACPASRRDNEPLSRLAREATVQQASQTESSGQSFSWPARDPVRKPASRRPTGVPSKPVSPASQDANEPASWLTG